MWTLDGDAIRERDNFVRLRTDQSAEVVRLQVLAHILGRLGRKAIGRSRSGSIRIYAELIDDLLPHGRSEPFAVRCALYDGQVVQLRAHDRVEHHRRGALPLGHREPIRIQRRRVSLANFPEVRGAEPYVVGRARDRRSVDGLEHGRAEEVVGHVRVPARACLAVLCDGHGLVLQAELASSARCSRLRDAPGGRPRGSIAKHRAEAVRQAACRNTAHAANPAPCSQARTDGDTTCLADHSTADSVRTARSAVAVQAGNPPSRKSSIRRSARTSCRSPQC